MRLQLILIFLFAFCLFATSQTSILYDLDTYKRVDGEYRTTFITPDVVISFDTTLNFPGFRKNYVFSIGGRYTDNQIYNDENYQKTKLTEVNLDFNFSENGSAFFNYIHDSDNRKYNDMKYFKHGLYFKTNNSYEESSGSARRYEQKLDVRYDLGFGFGRLEVINNAWLGGRILEELQIKGLLTEIPPVDEMHTFFDHIGDLEFERVMDTRLRFIYRVEKIIEFVEEKGWIEKGSIPAFLTIYDTFRFENFIIRQSGKRLEFTLVPTILANLSYNFRSEDKFSKNLQLGFAGNIEFESHVNGDLAYNTTKIVGGRLGYYERIRDQKIANNEIISGEVYFEYRYNYLPSLRTNLMLSSNISGGFIYDYSYIATLSMMAVAEYAYYFSPATRLSLSGNINYFDNGFQIGEYQPRIRTTFLIRIIHALR